MEKGNKTENKYKFKLSIKIPKKLTLKQKQDWLQKCTFKILISIHYDFIQNLVLFKVIKRKEYNFIL